MIDGTPQTLVDAFGRQHDYLRISLTDHCNLRCTYCMPEHPEFSAASRLMKPEEIETLAGIFVRDFGVKKIRLTGGEPLVRKEFSSILERLSQLKVKLALTTNGILLGQYFDELQAAGIGSLNLSLDSLDARRFEAMTRRNEFEKVWAHVQAALQRGFRIKLNMVVMRGVNDSEIAEFVKLSSHPQLHVRFIEFMPFEGNRWQWDQVMPYTEILERIGSAFPLEKLEDPAHSTSRAWRVPGFGGTFAVISTVTQHFCNSCNRLRLTADGKMRNCLFSTEETDLLSALRRGEDVRPLIRACLAAKKEKLGGLPAFQNEEEVKSHLSSRSMVAIGG